MAITDVKVTMIAAAPGPYSITRDSSHFKEFLMLEDDEGEASRDTHQQMQSRTIQGAEVLAPPGADEEAEAGPSSQQRFTRESLHPLRVVRNASRLTEEL
ncbi:hypothetical protein NDU88_005257 [Pleurodeles waltl]|uniref:Uncharacterized protein n=1 Tax=Pleurodeles waltl TaxID=8319 RepID=A0AAV7T9Y6_PLEWA|nr:hypothetical protein NDU88_005257 [Pleurodeles waltl]